MIKGDTNANVASDLCRATMSTTNKTTTTSTTGKAMATTKTKKKMPSPLLLLHSSYAVITFTTMFFIVTMHCQIANGALSRDSSYNSIYNNISMNNNDITVANNNNSMGGAAATVAAVTITHDDDAAVATDADADATHIIVDIDDDGEYARNIGGGGSGGGGAGYTDGGHDDADIYASRNLHGRTRLRRSPIFQNEFAVYVPNGGEMADSIAGKHGFANMGQVSLHFAAELFYYYY